ncbi:hypothetical protein ACJX0J_003056 [Zea mays]
MNLRYVEIFFSIYRDLDIEFKGMLFTFHVLRILDGFVPLGNGWIWNKTMLEVGSRIYTAELGFSERLVMVLYALFYVFLGFMGTYSDKMMKIQKRKWKPNS